MALKMLHRLIFRRRPLWKRQVITIARQMQRELGTPVATELRRDEGRLCWRAGADRYVAEVRWYPEAPETFRVMMLLLYRDAQGEPHPMHSFVGRMLRIE